MRISDWSSDVCSSDLVVQPGAQLGHALRERAGAALAHQPADQVVELGYGEQSRVAGVELQVEPGLLQAAGLQRPAAGLEPHGGAVVEQRSEEHTSELQSLMRNSYAVFCLKKKKEYNKKLYR